MKKHKMTSAMQRSWRPGGPSRIAYEKRMQDKKTMDHRTSQPAAKVIGHQKPEIGFIGLMYRAAAMLVLLSDADHHRNHAVRLISAADALLGIDQ